MSNIIDLNKRKTEYQEEKAACIKAAEEAEAQAGPRAQQVLSKMKQDELRQNNGLEPKNDYSDLVADLLQAAIEDADNEPL